MLANIDPLIPSPFVIAATFALPSKGTVLEGGSALMVCVQMMASLATATVVREVVVNLSTEYGTGISVLTAKPNIYSMIYTIIM